MNGYGYVLHRWEWDWVIRSWRCVAAKPGDVPSRDRCIGCGTIVTALRLQEFIGDEKLGCILSASLNFLAMWGDRRI